MQEITDWLDNLGMSEYAQRFAENRIDFSVLPDLTDQDLEKMGVVLGDRRKILRAIAGLGDPGKVAQQTLDTAGISAARPHDAAERRQVTVMFSDLVGSTALSARMDPEDLRFVISAYQKCVAETVQRFGGFVAKYMGDGVLVYFGYPQAHEDDAERALRAGLELIAAVGALKSESPLQTRVGIATGLVIVGDLIGSGEAQERGIVGETPNLAARLQGIAEPNTVVIGAGTRRLLGNLFELQDLGVKEVKGIAKPVHAWAALRASAVESRFEALRTATTPLVGRDEEVALLMRRWEQAKVGDGSVVLISGEPGIGKSRLAETIVERLAAEPHIRLRYFCSPQHTHSALYPIIRQMERATLLAHEDTPQAKLDKLDAVLVQTVTPKQDAGLFAEMLSLSNDGRYPALELTPRQRREKTLQALVAQIEALTRQSPVLMIFEDAHWIDPTTLEVIGLAVNRIQTLRTLLIITFRPEFAPPWIGRPHVTALTINRLAEREVGSIIEGVAGCNLIPANVRQDIIERTDGIPLFAEEMTKAVLEAESESAAQQTAAMVPSPALPVPASLHASLMARLDRLGGARELAQIGAAIGREFSHELLDALGLKPETELNLGLNRLVAAGLLSRQGVPPYASYLFKHALVQDAAYSTLLREPRRALHARIAQTIESQFAEIASHQPELLARHYTEAGLAEKAAIFWGKAGHRSLARSALIEAAEQLTRALAQIATLPSSAARRADEIKLQVALITPLMHVKGFAAPETKAAMERAHHLIKQAEALGETPDDPLLLFSILNGFWLVSYAVGNGDAILVLAGQFLALAQKYDMTFPTVLGHRMMGTSLAHMGDLLQGRAHLDQAIALYDPDSHRTLATRFGQDVRMASLIRRSLALWSLGYPEAALADANFAVNDAREIGHVATYFMALFFGSLAHVFCGDYATANALIDEGVALAEEKAALQWKLVVAPVWRGLIFAVMDKSSEAVQPLMSGLSLGRSAGTTIHFPFFLPHLATAYAKLGKLDDAWRCIDEATTLIETTKERWCEAEVYRVSGEVALLQRDTTKAKGHFERALTIARQQQARSWELRAAMSMARLWRDQGKRGEARELLAPVYGWFTEGFDTLDLKEAKALLDELGA